MHWVLNRVCKFEDEDIISTSSALFLGCLVGTLVNHSIVHYLSKKLFLTNSRVI